jgi:hypothetical protein
MQEVEREEQGERERDREGGKEGERERKNGFCLCAPALELK